MDPREKERSLTIQPLITSARLADFLKIDEATLRRWRVESILQSVYINKVCHYTVAPTDYFLANCEHNFKKPLTIQQLSSGEITLVRSEQACAQLELTYQALVRRIRSGQLRGIKLGSQFRVCTKSIIEYNHKKDQDAHNLLRRDLVYHIFGVTKPYVDAWVRQGELQQVSPAILGSSRRQFTRTSVLALLTKLLPDWANPDIWLEDRLKDRMPLMTRAQVENYLGLDCDGLMLRQLIIDRRLWFITMPGGNRKFLPTSVDALLYQGEQITYDKISQLFGASQQDIAQWISIEGFHCVLHRHNDSSLYRPCVLGLLELYLNKGTSARLWYKRYIASTDPFMDIKDGACFLGISQENLLDAIEKGALPAVGVPIQGIPQWRIPLRELQKLKQ